MAIYRASTNADNFTVVSNTVINDQRLTWEARGLLIHLLSKPPQWEVVIAALINQTEGTRKQSGRDSVYTIMKELQAVGYVRKGSNRNAGGKFNGSDWYVFDTAQAPAPRAENPDAAPHTDLPDTAQPDTANTTLERTDVKKELKGRKNGDKNTCASGDAPADSDEQGDEVKAVFGHWATVMKSPRSKLDGKRKKAIRTALDLGYSTADLCKAIDGCSKSPFHMGLNERRTKYNGIDLILRDADKIDGFMAKDDEALADPTAPTGGNAQQAKLDGINNAIDALKRAAGK